MKYISLLTYLLFSGSMCFLCTSCDNAGIVISPPDDCVPDGVEAIVSGEFVDPEDGPLCFYATELSQSYLHYNLNLDGSSGLDFPLVPWSTIFLEISFSGTDELESSFTIHLRNSVLDSLEAFNSPPVPLTAELILERLLTPGEHSIVGRGLHSIAYDARLDYVNNRFSGYTYNSYQLPPDAGSITILNSELRSAVDGTQFFDLELSFNTRIRKYYDENSWRDIQNGHLVISIPVDDLIPA